MRKTVLLTSMASLAGLLALMILLVTVSTWGASPRAADAASGVKVMVACKGTPETTRVENNTKHRITVKKVGSVHQPRSNEPFRVGVKLARGKSVTFESGYDANSRVLTKQYIYDNEVGSKEGARVATSVGRFVDRCG
jgi:hypothetical protein